MPRAGKPPISEMAKMGYISDKEFYEQYDREFKRQKNMEYKSGREMALLSEVEYQKARAKRAEDQCQIGLMIIGIMAAYFGGYVEIPEKDMVAFKGEVTAAKSETKHCMVVEVKNDGLDIEAPF